MIFTILNNNSQEVKVNDLLAQTAGGAVPDRSFKLTGIVVGDSRQMPPSNAFSSNNGAYVEDDNDQEDDPVPTDDSRVEYDRTEIVQARLPVSREEL